MEPQHAPQERAASSRHHVLLIGIDAYQKASSLFGCVNDIDAVQTLLLDRVRVPKEHIRRFASPRTPQPGEPARPTVVPTEQPTRANLLRALEELGTERVRPQDRVLIYYSGHGTQRMVKTAGGHFLQEALIPSDDTLPDDTRQYLFDWELNALLQKIAARTSSVTVILDACNSAGATRDLPEPGARDRFDPPPAEPYELPPEVPPPPAGADRGVALGLSAGAGRCMVVAACLDCERARESAGTDGKAHGELTRALLAQLGTLPEAELPDLIWGRIWRPLVAAVSQVNTAQHPWLSDSPSRRVFGGPPTDGDVGYGVAATGHGYQLDAGSLSGVTKGAEVAVYPALPAKFPVLGSQADKDLRLGVLKVTYATRAGATAVALAPLPKFVGGERGRLIKVGEAARLPVALSEPAPSLEAALRKSSLLDVASAGVKGEVTLVRRADGNLALIDEVYGAGENAGEPSLPALPSDKPEAVARFVEHYYRYSAPLRLARGCTDLPHSLRVKVLDCHGLTARVPAEQAQEPPFDEVKTQRGSAYVLKAEGAGATGDMYCIRVDNTSSENLHVTLFNCQDDGRVVLLASRANVRGGGHATFWYPGSLGEPLRAVLEPGKRLGLDRLVAVGTTNANASLDHLKMDTDDDTFQAVLGKDRGLRPAFGGPPEIWTSAITVLRLEA